MKAVVKRNNKIKELEKDLKKQKVLNARYRKQMERLRKKQDKHQTTKGKPHLSSTPKSKTLSEIRLKNGVPSQVKRKLLFANCVLEEIKESYRKNPDHKQAINRIVSGRIIKNIDSDLHCLERSGSGRNRRSIPR